MSMFEKIEAATEAGDAQAYTDLLSDDFVFVRHQDGSTLNKNEVTEMLKSMMSSGSQFGERRRIYENDDILVLHSVNDYPDGSREAVLAAYSLRGGKITRLETGATLLST